MKFLIFAAIILGAIYAYLFTDWFAEKKIQIKYRILPGRGAAGGVEPIMFYLEKEYPITSIKVISLADAATNKYPHALWELVSQSNSVPVTDFIYGENPAGMKAKIAGLAAEALAPNGKYRIFLETTKLKGEKDFEARGTK
ncbi:MAG: hypothetical protein ABIP71_02395 [Verrucomicrobiota bacterium]